MFCIYLNNSNFFQGNGGATRHGANQGRGAGAGSGRRRGGGVNRGIGGLDQG